MPGNLNLLVSRFTKSLKRQDSERPKTRPFKGTRPTLSKATFFVVVFSLSALCVVFSIIAPPIFRIQNLATVTKNETIPLINFQNRAALSAEAIKIEALNIIATTDKIKRRASLQRAKFLSTSLYSSLSPDNQEVLRNAIDRMFKSAELFDQHDQVLKRINDELAMADSIIEEVDDTLGSIVEDTSSSLRQLMDDFQPRSANDLEDTRYFIQHVLTTNEHGQELLIGIRNARNLIAKAVNTSDTDKFVTLSAQFEDQFTRLETIASQMIGNADYEYLPDNIASFAELSTVFTEKREALKLREDAEVLAQSALQQLTRVREGLADGAGSIASQSISDIEILVNAISRNTIGAGLGAVALALVLAILIRHALVAPLQETTEVLNKLSKGDLTAELTHAPLAEFGNIRLAIERFRGSLSKLAELRLSLIGKLDVAVTGIVSKVADNSTMMGQISHSLDESAKRTSERSSAVAEISQQAAESVTGMATAAEELSRSIEEINGQVRQSQNMAKRAVDAAADTKETVATLSDQALAIEDIVGIIRKIAAQTKLLALNATIEASRAGASGQGFSVVASEIKVLARQTGEATERITNQINVIREASHDSVDTLQTISNIIDQMNNISGEITESVENQRFATSAISQNAQQLAVGASNVTHQIENISSDSLQTGQLAVQVTEKSDEMESQISSLHSEMVKIREQSAAA